MTLLVCMCVGILYLFVHSLCAILFRLFVYVFSCSSIFLLDCLFMYYYLHDCLFVRNFTCLVVPVCVFACVSSL